MRFYPLRCRNSGLWVLWNGKTWDDLTSTGLLLRQRCAERVQRGWQAARLRVLH